MCSKKVYNFAEKKYNKKDRVGWSYNSWGVKYMYQFFIGKPSAIKYY